MRRNPTTVSTVLRELIMTVELAGIQLKRVHQISTIEQAALVYHRILGREGNLVQNLGC
ncbi:MAG UNVERIFIED_CONTAM: hypothetical protein LVR29_06300 [Microcystis novacekii LVE1205-3]